MNASLHQLSPESDMPARKMKPLRQSTLNHGRYAQVLFPPAKTPSRADLCQSISPAFTVLECSSEQNSSVSHVAHWAERYLDSGVSMQMDTTESLGSDYDSDDARSSVETVHHSYSEVEVRAAEHYHVIVEEGYVKHSASFWNFVCFLLCYSYQR